MTAKNPYENARPFSSNDVSAQPFPTRSTTNSLSSSQPNVDALVRSPFFSFRMKIKLFLYLTKKIKTEEEREAIMNVIMRDERLREDDSQRVK